MKTLLFAIILFMFGISPAFSYTNLFVNSQWQILDNTSTQAIKIAPGTLGVVSPFTIGSTSTTTAPGVMTFNITSGSPNLYVNDLVALSGAGFNAALKITPIRVLSVTGSPATSFTGIPPHGYFGSGNNGTGQQIYIADLGAAHTTATGAWWKKTSGLVYYPMDPTTYPGFTDPGALRCLGLYKNQVSNPQTMYQNLSSGLVTQLQNQTITASFRVNQWKNGGSGTSNAYITVNGVTTNGLPAGGSGNYEDVQVTASIPPNATSIQVGINLTGTSTDAYYVCKPMLAQTDYLPPNTFSQPVHDFVKPTEDIVPTTYNNASLKFPSILDATGVYYSVYVDHFAESLGRVHYSITCISGTQEYRTTQAGTAIDTRNVMGNPSGAGIIYGTAIYAQVANITTAGKQSIPTDDGNQVNSAAQGFQILYTPNSGLSVTNLSWDVDGYCLN